jgi:hypothetical protein
LRNLTGRTGAPSRPGRSPAPDAPLPVPRGRPHRPRPKTERGHGGSKRSDGPSPAPLKGSQHTKTTIDRIVKEKEPNQSARTPDAFGRSDSTRQGARRPGRRCLRVVFTSGKGNSTVSQRRVNKAPGKIKEFPVFSHLTIARS